MWRTAYNAAVDVLRKTKPTEPLSDHMEELDAGSRRMTDESVRDYSRKTQIEELYEHIELLSEPDKTIVKLQLQGYNYKEIGDATGMTEKNVSVRLVRVKERLRQSMCGKKTTGKTIG